ncbi:MAG TPA: non-canonical purine NTP diphosphatase [Flavobacteriaceae bacterium]|nr:non-canonical purine NTP diphosphatase [Flavobacteriaceae bacterium]
MKLVFATHNPNKLKEIQSLLPKEIELLSLEEIGCFEEIPETAETIEANALLKARYVQEKFGYNCFADDTGLEVEALNGGPGVYSARYAGEEKSDVANIDKLLKELKNENNRSARFKTVIALIWKGEEFLFEGICEGKIIDEKRGNGGFGYDPVFVPAGQTKTFAEMKLWEKNEFSHRGKAFRKLQEFLKSFSSDL